MSNWLELFESGSVAEIVEFINASRIDVLKDYDGLTALGWAIVFGRPSLLKLFISHGASVDVAGPGERGTLELCVSENRIAMLRTLLLAGANPNYQDEDGQSALMVASKGGNIRAISTLIEFGADPNIIDNLGRSALRWLCSGGDYVDAAKKLIEAGAKFKTHDRINSLTPLQCAKDMGFVKLYQYMQSIDSDPKI